MNTDCGSFPAATPQIRRRWGQRSAFAPCPPPARCAVLSARESANAAVGDQELTPQWALPRRLAAIFPSIALAAAVAFAACSANAPDPAPSYAARAQSEPTHPTVSGDRLQALLAQRSKDEFSDKLDIGPGDVIEITVAGVPELRKYRARVSEDDTISVPLAGVLQVGGMTEEDLRQALYQRLEKPVKDPQVEVFVVQYHSREVAVVGMVHKPGLYSITSRSDTILDMVDRAGGMTDQASSRLLFIPAPSGGGAARLELAQALAEPAGEQPSRVDPIAAAAPPAQREVAESRDQVRGAGLPNDPAQAGASGSVRLASFLGGVEPIEVDLSAAAREGQLDVPVRPGDTIIVPAAGEVMVDGWVANPGAFRIVPGMTALSAVSAAGGALFSHTAEVLRTNPDGSRRAIVVDLSKVKAGEEADVPVEAGDVVFVQRTVLGAVPYAFYEIFTKFGTGVYAPVP